MATPKQRFERNERILNKLANLDSAYLLGNVERKKYLKQRLKLKMDFQKNY